MVSLLHDFIFWQRPLTMASLLAGPRLLAASPNNGFPTRRTSFSGSVLAWTPSTTSRAAVAVQRLPRTPHAHPPWSSAAAPPPVNHTLEIKTRQHLDSRCVFLPAPLVPRVLTKTRLKSCINKVTPPFVVYD